MSKNCNKIKHTCASRNFATCIDYENDINEDSSLDVNSCISVDEALKDIYTQLEGINLSQLGEGCLEYLLEDNKIKVKNVLKKFEDKICELNQKITELETITICNTNIEDCNLNLYDLVDSCGQQPSTLAEVLQLLLDQTQINP